MDLVKEEPGLDEGTFAIYSLKEEEIFYTKYEEHHGPIPFPKLVSTVLDISELLVRIIV
jgi:hypothetical protein